MQREQQLQESQQRPTLDYCTPLRLSTWKTHESRTTKSHLKKTKTFTVIIIVRYSDCQHGKPM